jgi:heme ABC exporter ATP-binding subunit CcmA
MIEKSIAIRVRGLSKVFNGRPVVQKINFDIAEAQSVGVTGVNGAGKTTLLRCLAGIIRPTTGEIYWHGRPAGANPNLRRLIGMLAHETRLYPHLTARENLLFAARMYDIPRPELKTEELLERMGLRPFADCLTSRISRGMRQRMAIARSIVHEPRILLLDEPFTGLDEQGTAWLMDYMTERQRQGRTNCFVTHDSERLRRLANTIFELRFGELHERAVARMEPESTTNLARRAA